MEKNYEGNYDAKFEELLGKVLTKIDGDVGDGTMQFHTNDGEVYQMHYYEDCCATCTVEEIHGDLSDLIGSPILQAEEVISEEPNDDIKVSRRDEYEEKKREWEKDGHKFYYDSYEDFCDSRYESETWTFYKLATIKGSVTIRWYGSSNGYYSESVTFERLP